MFDGIAKERGSLAERFPQKDPSDRAHDAARIVFSLWPGGAAAEVFSLVLTPSIVRRRDEWLIEAASAIDEILKWKEGFRLEDLQQNEKFISALIVATRIATSTHHQEKRRMLRNILVKMGTKCDLDEDLQFVYLRLLDDLSPTHVRILDFFWRGNARVAVLNGGQMPGSMRHQEFVLKLLPELHGKPHVEQILQDLRSRGLCNAQDLTAGFSSSVMTNYGISFLGFVLSPEEIGG